MKDGHNSKSDRPNTGSAAYWFRNVRDALWEPEETPEGLEDKDGETQGWSKWVNFPPEIFDIIFNRWCARNDIEDAGKLSHKAMMEQMMMQAMEFSSTPHSYEDHLFKSEYRELYINDTKGMINARGWKIVQESLESLPDGDRSSATSSKSEKKASFRVEVIEIRDLNFDGEKIRVTIGGVEYIINLPPWQRPEGAWEKTDRIELLLDSFRRGIPIPPIIGWQRPEKILALVDGQQRMQTIRHHHEKGNLDEELLGTKICFYILETEDMGIVSDLFQRLNTKGKTLTAIELTLLTYYRDPLNERLIAASREIIETIRDRNRDKWIIHLAKTTLGARASSQESRSTLKSSKDDEPISRDEMAIYKVLTHTLAYSRILTTVEENPSTKKTVEAMFNQARDMDKEEIDERIDKAILNLLCSFKASYDIFGRKHSFVNSETRRHNEWRTRVQVAEIEPFLDAILHQEELSARVSRTWKEVDFRDLGFDEADVDRWNVSTTNKGFEAYFFDRAQNAQSIWRAHELWRELLIRECEMSQESSDLAKKTEHWIALEQNPAMEVGSQFIPRVNFKSLIRSNF